VRALQTRSFRGLGRAFRRSRVPDATKPHELPRTASVSTRIRSARVLAGFHRPLRRRTSYRCFSRHAARLSSLVTSLHHTGESLVTRGRRCHRRERIIHWAAAFVQEAKTLKRRLSTRNLRCPRRSAAISRNTHSPTRLEHIRSTCCGCDSALGPGMRRSPVSFPTWLQSARESICACPRQLSSAKAASNFESAFRSSAARLAPRVTVSAPASFSSLARRRCLRRDRIIRAARTTMQYPQTSAARLSTRKLTSPRQPTPIPAIHTLRRSSG
jgi:hypothetical protein